MPLNDSQQKFIDACLIDYLDEFLEQATDPDTFNTKLTLLKTAIRSEGEETIADFFLYNCFRNPEAFFFRLETLSETPITLAETKAYMARLIAPRLAEKALLLGLAADDLWNTDELVATLSGHDNITAFCSGKPPTESGSNPWSHDNPDYIYSVSVYGEYPWVWATIYTKMNAEVRFEDKIQIAKLVDDDGESLEFEDDAEEDEYISGQLPSAIAKAERIAATNVLTYLTDKGLVVPSEYSNPDADRVSRGVPHITLGLPVLEIITHRYYFDCLQNGTLRLIHFKDLDKNQVANLLDPTVISLIADKWLRFTRAKTLNEGQRRLLSIPQYQQLIRKKARPINDFLLLSQNERRVFMDSAIINLMGLNKISFLEARALSPYHLAIIGHPFYYDLVIKQPGLIRWRDLAALTQRDCHFFLRRDIIQFIANENIDINTALSALTARLEEKYGASVTKQIELGNATVTEIDLLSSQTRQHIRNHPFIAYWLDNKVLKIQDLEKTYVYDAVVSIYANRLLAIFLNQPRVINRSSDSVDNIRAELPAIARYHVISMETLNESIIKMFLKKINIHLAELAVAQNNPSLRDVYNHCCVMIIKAEQAERFHEKTKEAYWQNTLGDLINYLDHSLAQFEPQQYMIGGHHLTLFPAAKRKKNTVENIRRLSAHLSEFECFSQTKRHAALNRSQ